MIRYQTFIITGGEQIYFHNIYTYIFEEKKNNNLFIVRLFLPMKTRFIHSIK